MSAPAMVRFCYHVSEILRVGEGLSYEVCDGGTEWLREFL
jgi:hypothetical protein